MPNTDQDLNQDYTPYQLTGDDLSELHGLAQQLQSAGDPRADRVFSFIDAHSGGNPDPAAKGSINRAPLKVTSWLDDLENTLWGSNTGPAVERSSTSGTASDPEPEAPPTGSPEMEVGNGDSAAQPEPDAGSTTDDDYVYTGPLSDLSGGTVRRRQHSDNYKIENEGVTPGDLASGNYVRVGFRHLLGNNPSELAYHAYFEIPNMENGGPVTDPRKQQFDSYGVLGDEGTRNNQQVRKNDWRNDQLEGREGKVVYIKVTPEQREALRERLEYFSKNDNGRYEHPCPVCGPNYHLLGQNSNTFAYNMLFWNPAGMVWAPKPPDNKMLIHPTPEYKKNLGQEGWYK